MNIVRSATAVALAVVLTASAAAPSMASGRRPREAGTTTSVSVVQAAFVQPAAEQGAGTVKSAGYKWNSYPGTVTTAKATVQQASFVTAVPTKRTSWYERFVNALSLWSSFPRR